MLKPIIGSLIRHGLTGLAGWLVLEGHLAEKETENFIKLFEAAGVVAIALIWSFWEKGSRK